MKDPAPFQRARSSEAKAVRERAILDAARALAAERSIRAITLTDIAEAVGMHKSAMLRYFETREEIFLRLTADEADRLRARGFGFHMMGAGTARFVTSWHQSAADTAPLAAAIRAL